VFLHGGGISSWMWREQVEAFKDFHCIVPDLPEHRKSMDEGPLSLSDCALRVADLIDSAAGGKAHVVGHSLGAKVIVELLARRPGVVGRAVVASALFRPVPLLKLMHKPYVYRMTVSMLKSPWMLSATAKQFKFRDKGDIENLKRDFRSLTADSLYRIYDQLYQYQQLPDGLAAVDAPTLVLAGQKEPAAMKRSVQDILNVLPGSKGLLLPGADHTYPWAMPEKFSRIVRAWLTGQDPSGEGIAVRPR
jgi:pimeloyl-ACP methyl ester carboxylesterase